MRFLAIATAIATGTRFISASGAYSTPSIVIVLIYFITATYSQYQKPYSLQVWPVDYFPQQCLDMYHGCVPWLS